MATDVVTGIDSLLTYINKNGEIDTSTLANALGISESTLLEWSTVLEKAKLIIITYKLGKMYISPSKTSITVNNEGTLQGEKSSGVESTKDVTVEEIKKLSEIKSTIIQDTLNMQRKNIEIINNKIKEFKGYIDEAGKSLKENEPKMKNITAELLGFRVEASKNLMDITNYMNQIATVTEQLRSGNFDFSKEYLSFEDVDIVSKNARAIIDDIRSKSSYMRSTVDTVIKEFNKNMNDSKIRLIEWRDTVKKEEKTLNGLADNIQKQLSSYDQKLEEYKRNASETNMKIKKEREVVLDKASMAKQRIDKIYSISTKKFEGVDDEITRQLEAFKKVEEKYNEINNIKISIDEIVSDNENLKKEIDELSEQLKKINVNKKETPFSKYKKILENEKKTKNINEKMKGLNERIGEIGSITEQKESKKKR